MDQIMSSHGKQIMQAVTLILEAEHSAEIKEQVRGAEQSRYYYRMSAAVFFFFD